ncbi:MAG: 3-oxoacyl-[acyl-carrier-protein] reductase [Caldisericia bacterium]
MKEFKNAIVTGGTRGIGKAIVYELAKNGYNIGLNFLKSINEAIKIKDDIEKNYNLDVLLLKGDISISDNVKNIVNHFIEKFGSIDLLVNNAGITKDNLIIRMKPEDFLEVINVNLTAAFLMIKEVLPNMIKNKNGSIINISSIVGIYGNTGQANYSASKGGLISLTKSIAKEVASRNIRVNAIAPGYIETEMTSILNDDLKKNIIEKIPLRRFGKPEDVSKLVTFLASPESSYITGQVFIIDGGLSLGF